MSVSIGKTSVLRSFILKDKEKPRSNKERWVVGRKESNKLKLDSMNKTLEEKKEKACDTSNKG